MGHPASLLPFPSFLLPDASAPHYRPVTIVNASARKQLKLRIEVPVEDMARLGDQEAIPSGPASQAPKRVSIWNAIHPRLLEIIREKTSTILFVNSRQVAERLAGALNELAGEPIARAHHGSLAAAQRTVIEEQLKAGQIRALCATSTLELGIDMGAVDLVIQIEAPPSVASGMQRIGRAGHHVDAVSEGILFPKYRADLVACAAVTRAMHEGHIESTRYPRNPLDVLAQQLVAIVASAGKAEIRGQGSGVRKAAKKKDWEQLRFEATHPKQLSVVSGQCQWSVISCQIPRLRIQTWGTRSLGNLTPTLATKTETSRGWGTRGTRARLR